MYGKNFDNLDRGSESTCMPISILFVQVKACAIYDDLSEDDDNGFFFFARLQQFCQNELYQKLWM
jgi:hypothetical protein